MKQARRFFRDMKKIFEMREARKSRLRRHAGAFGAYQLENMVRLDQKLVVMGK